jgi:hypothetical protein
MRLTALLCAPHWLAPYHLERLGDNQPTIFADTSHVLNELDLQSLINY